MNILLIQTAFIGDVILATPVIEQLSAHIPGVKIDFLLRAGNEDLLANNPGLSEILIWNKKENKLGNLVKLIKQIRAKKYDVVINMHRFASSGLITFLSGAKQKRGFNKNPFSFCYTTRVKHELEFGKHEVERNLELVKGITSGGFTRPKLYPATNDFKAVEQFSKSNGSLLNYSCIAPTSVWFTKQYPKEKWVELIALVKTPMIYLLGAPSDTETCEWIRSNAKNKMVINLCGKLSFLESAALMRDAAMNYVNDSAPLHIASAMNAKVTAIFCSTIPAFGFGPLSYHSKVVETKEMLKCRPCGLHGYKACPEGHFKCAWGIEVEQIAGSN